VATIANATTLLVDLGWNGFGLSDVFWTVIALAAGLVIGVATTLKNKDAAYGIVILWAYLGILLKHLPSGAFMGQYMPIIIAVSMAMGITAAAVVIAWLKMNITNKKEISPTA
jgi:hypothetical protein